MSNLEPFHVYKDPISVHIVLGPLVPSVKTTTIGTAITLTKASP